MSENPLWMPSASIDNLQKRAQIIAKIRQFFNKNGYLEVETPALSHFGVTDVYLANIQAFFRGKKYYLQTSPEYHMKRLLAAGSGPIFQIAKVFRDDELGRWHNPEFTMLEWYHLNTDHYGLMDETDSLLQMVLGSEPMIRKTYQEVFEEICFINPFSATIDDFKTVLKKYELDNVLPEAEQDRDQYLFLLMSHVVEPSLGKQPIAIYHFPASQASLAKVNHGVAERFEVYVDGVELANGFHELTDANKQADRFQNDLQMRQQKGLYEPKADSNFLQALQAGLPMCSGIALGIDRLITLALNQNSIADAISFGFDRA